jgi:hypothetical protein
MQFCRPLVSLEISFASELFVASIDFTWPDARGDILFLLGSFLLLGCCLFFVVRLLRVS